MRLGNYFALLVVMLGAVQARAENMDSAFSTITDPKQIERITQSFQKNLKEYVGSTGQIERCHHLVWFHGRNNWGKDVSFGGACSVKLKSSVPTFFMCDDVMVGKFTLQTSGVVSDDWIRKFVEANCPPGS